jgi:hypothetical protein
MLICDMDICRRRMPDHPLVYITAVIMTAKNFYSLYIIYSFIHHLADGNIDLIEGRAFRLNDTSNFSEVLVRPAVRRIYVANCGQTQTEGTETNEYSMVDKITLTNAFDLTFAQSAQNAVISGVTLPSGLRVPIAKDGKDWRIVGNEILQI